MRVWTSSPAGVRGRAQTAIAVLFGLLAAAVPASADVRGQRPGLESLRWMVGSWAGSAEGVQTEELWIAASGGVMLGLHRDVGPDGKAFFEYLRITETESGLSYVAQPLGHPPTEFTLRQIDAQRVVFENPRHDYPQRIIYRLDGDGRLVARIEGDVDGRPRSSEWHWTRRE